MSNSEEAIKSVQTLLNKYFERKSSEDRFSDARDPAGAKLPIYLPFESCPSGLVACDESKGKCPSDEYAVNPPIYTSEGHRCYTKQGVARSRLSDKDKDVVVKGVRALVANIARLRDANVELDRILKEGISEESLLKLYRSIPGDKPPFHEWLPTQSRKFRGRDVTQEERKLIGDLAKKYEGQNIAGGYGSDDESEYDMY